MAIQPMTEHPNSAPLLSLVPLAALLLLSGCSTTPARMELAADTGLPRQVTGATPDSRAEQMYRVLVAEVAGHRGRLDVSVENYLEVAEATRDPQVAERALRIAVFARDDEAAKRAASLWSELEPEKLEAHRILAALHLRTGDADAAVTELNYLMDRWQGPVAQGYQVVLESLARERDKETAREVMGRFMATRQDDPEALLTYARFAVRTGDQALAGEVLERVLEQDPGNDAAALLFAQVLQDQNRTERALDYLAQVLAANPDNLPLRTAYARMLVHGKRYDAALAEFETLARRAPDNSDIRFAHALLLLQTNRNSDAREAFTALLADPNRALTAHYYLGQIAEVEEQPAVARGHYEKVDRGQHYLDAQVRIAVLLAEAGKLSAAREHLHGIAADTDTAIVRLYRVEAELLNQAGLGEAALSTFDRGLQELPGNVELLYSRAMQGERLGQVDILERDLRSILDQDPKHAQALNALGYTLADRTDRYQEAYGYIKQALELRPDDYYILDSMGWVLYRLGRLPEALEYLQRAAAKSQDPEVAAHLGELLWVMGDRAAAREVWNNALQASPDAKKLLDVIKRFDP